MTVSPVFKMFALVVTLKKLGLLALLAVIGLFSGHALAQPSISIAGAGSDPEAQSLMNDMYEYAQKLRTAIKNNVPESLDRLPGNPTAVFEVVQAPNGEVLSVLLKKSSGIGTFDDAVEQAIKKTSPLPLPDNPELFQARFEIVYEVRSRL